MTTAGIVVLWFGWQPGAVGRYKLPDKQIARARLAASADALRPRSEQNMTTYTIQGIRLSTYSQQGRVYFAPAILERVRSVRAS
jgi:hypothetical protein